MARAAPKLEPCLICYQTTDRYSNNRRSLHVRARCVCGHTWVIHEGHGCPICGLANCFGRLALPTGCGRTCTDCFRKGVALHINPYAHSETQQPTVHGVRLHAGKALGLKPMQLAREAADLYVLMELCHSPHVGPPPIGTEEALSTKTHMLAEQLATYLEIACTGEFRHALSISAYTISTYKATGGLLMADADTLSDGTLAVLKDMLPVLTASGSPDLSDKNSTRTLAWAVWPQLRDRYGLDVYQYIADGFRKLWSRADTSVGGALWAVCMETVERYRRGLVSAVLFTDTAFGLKHNGNIAYDKFWNVLLLPYVLDAVHAGDMSRVEHFASSRVAAKRCKWLNDESVRNYRKRSMRTRELMQRRAIASLGRVGLEVSL